MGYSSDLSPTEHVLDFLDQIEGKKATKQARCEDGYSTGLA